jgi:hypothetical protein
MVNLVQNSRRQRNLKILLKILRPGGWTPEEFPQVISSATLEC